ncbi:MAG: hypothetical protein KZQ96_21000 [Candidatus Thiodiazotropha sp. (ex Lucinoma borealis)]|nr:hypothetical protein [Candidatus Thiodiazotropha sp. (ex Lucinoma borealis)]
MLDTILLLLLMIFVETGINATFLQNAHMVTGPLSALLASLLISLTNVTVSVCAGYFIGRWINYGTNAADADEPEFAIRRQIAQALFVLFLVVIAGFHLTVGLVRALASLDNIHHSVESYTALFTTPEAVFLVLTGACLSVLAYHKGLHSFNDPYPGYGERHRTVLTRRIELFEAYEELSEALTEQFDGAICEAVKCAKIRGRAVEKYHRVVGDCLKAHRRLQRSVGEAETVLRLQVAQLATHHRGVRGRKSTVTSHSLGQLVSFEGFLGTELPPFLHVPSSNEAKAPLAQAKAQALSRLSQLYDRILQTEHGDKQ